jgi:hypothetical protein
MLGTMGSPRRRPTRVGDSALHADVVAVLDGLADAVVAASVRGEIVYANPAAASSRLACQ